MTNNVQTFKTTSATLRFALLAPTELDATAMSFAREKFWMPKIDEVVSPTFSIMTQLVHWVVMKSDASTLILTWTSSFFQYGWGFELLSLQLYGMQF